MAPHNKNNAIDVWLMNEINSGKHKGLMWLDEKKQTFSIPWVHASRRQWKIENDASLYMSWAKYKRRYKEGMKSVQIRSFFWSVFSRIQSECSKIRTRKNSVFGHFSRSGTISFPSSNSKLLSIMKRKCFKLARKILN